MDLWMDDYMMHRSLNGWIMDRWMDGGRRMTDEGELNRRINEYMRMNVVHLMEYPKKKIHSK